MYCNLFLATVALALLVSRGACSRAPCEGFKCSDGSACLPISGRCNYTQECPDSSDEADCVGTYGTLASSFAIPSFGRRCTPYQRKCPNQNKCINLNKFCNGFRDCADGSDEVCHRGTTHLPTRTSTISVCIGFLCAGKCFGHKSKCDGVRDCPDGTDEINCPCQPHQFKCMQGACIHQNWLCDGTKDCVLGDDEGTCRCGMCKQNEFKCFKDNQCVGEEKRCDGVKDCEDFSDETNCVSQENNVVRIKHRGNRHFALCADYYNYAALNALCASLGMEKMTTFAFEPLLPHEPSLTIKTSSNKQHIMDILQPTTCRNQYKIRLFCEKPKCGKRDESFELKDSYIVNGKRSRLGQWPWTAQLLKDGSFYCSASILSRRWILTAAHCAGDFNQATGQFVEDKNANSYKVLVGIVNLRTAKQKDLLDVEKVLPFNYQSSLFKNDVALMKLKKPLSFNDKIQPICLADARSFEKDSPTYEVCVAAGYGAIKKTYNIKYSEDHLAHGKMNLIPDSKCYGYNNHRNYYDQKQHLCAGHYPAALGTNICFGDSGGPLMCRKPGGVWVQVGVASFVYGNCQKSVWARASTFHDTIQSIIRNDP